MNAAATLLGLVLIPGTHTPSKPECQLPTPDNLRGASTPNMTGTIATVDRTSFTLRRSESKPSKVYRLHHDRRTEMFTMLGGTLDADHLRSGQWVFVWFRGCRAPIKGRRTPVAVVVLVSEADREHPLDSVLK
jgi:hypothetical protein